MSSDFYLEHFNPYHDALGRFAKAGVSVAAKGGKVVEKGAKAHDKIEQQKRIAKDVAIGAAVVGGVIATGVAVSYARQHAYENSKGEISKNFTNKQIMDVPANEIRAGSVLNRMSTAEENDFKNDYTFATFTKDDKNRYAYAMGKERGTNSLYQMTLRATKTIKTPSSHEQLKMFEKLLREDAGFEKALLSDYGLERSDGRTKEEQRRAYGDKVHLDLYSMFVDSWYRPGKASETRGATKIFRDYAKKQGYDALVDTTDAGIIGDRPLYVIDPKDSLTVEKVRKMNRGKRIANGLMLKKMPSPKTIDFSDRAVSSLFDL